MSIESKISIAFYSDCNTFATPTDSICAIVESFNKKVGRSNARSSYGVCFTELLAKDRLSFSTAFSVCKAIVHNRALYTKDTRFGSVRPRVQISPSRLESTRLAFWASRVDLNRLRIRGLETADLMALIREVRSEPTQFINTGVLSSVYDSGSGGMWQRHCNTVQSR